jgi:hypothetical protein
MFLQKCDDFAASKMMRVICRERPALGQNLTNIKIRNRLKDKSSQKKEVLKMTFLGPLFLETYYQWNSFSQL